MTNNTTSQNGAANGAAENTQENQEPIEASAANGQTADQASNQATAQPNPIETLQTKVKEAEQKYVYLYADFENYKKRAGKERQDALKYGWESIAGELLGVLDNLDRALQHAKPDTDANLLTGLKMVAQQFRSTLEKQGVLEIQTENQAFNPELHEAVGQLPSEKSEGTIVQEHQKGYTLHGRLLRPSRVMVSSGKAAN